MIALTQLSLLATVEPLFAECVIPIAVAQEIARSVTRPAWIRRMTPTRPIDQRIVFARLGAGESEAIALELQRGSYQVVLDDRDARRLAASLGLLVIGTAGILVAAKRAGLIMAVAPQLDALANVGFFLAPDVIRRTLIDAGEPQ